MNREMPSSERSDAAVGNLVGSLAETVAILKQRQWEDGGLKRFGEAVALQAQYQEALASIQTWIEKVQAEGGSEAEAKVVNIQNHLREIQLLQRSAENLNEMMEKHGDSTAARRLEPQDQGRVDKLFDHLKAIERIMAD